MAMRDNYWLFNIFEEVWNRHFGDITQANDIKIKWGRMARAQLGSIKKRKTGLGKHPETVITINGLFKDLRIPEFVVIGTIAHEISHYAHGFSSPLKKKYKTPHAGGIVRNELKRRGLEKILKAQKKWLKENWQNYIKENFPKKIRQRRRRMRIVVKWI